MTREGMFLTSFMVKLSIGIRSFMQMSSEQFVASALALATF